MAGPGRFSTPVDAREGNVGFIYPYWPGAYHRVLAPLVRLHSSLLPSTDLLRTF
jgi:hypothetical protein